MTESECKELVIERFKTGNKRSEVYQAAYEKSFRYFLGKYNHLSKVKSLKCPYAEGTLHFDAWFAGWDNGRNDAEYPTFKTGKD